MERDLELKMARLEVKLLRAQFNSHFLFNNLSAINYRILNQDPTDASNYLNIFSRLLRRTLADSRFDFVTLSDEIETLKLYVKMENMRFDRHVDFVVSIPPDMDTDLIQLPSLVLHTYIQKAIWRSLQPGDSQYTINLRVIEHSGKQHVMVEDYALRNTEVGLPLIAEQPDSGMSMIEERTRLLNELHGIDIQILFKTRDSAASVAPHRIDISFTPFFIKNLSQVTHF